MLLNIYNSLPITERENFRFAQLIPQCIREAEINSIIKSKSQIRILNDIKTKDDGRPRYTTLSEEFVDEIGARVDILIPDIKLVIQVDGPNHFYEGPFEGVNASTDFNTKRLENAGYTVLRILSNEHKINYIEKVSNIANKLKKQTKKAASTLSNLGSIAKGAASVSDSLDSYRDSRTPSPINGSITTEENSDGLDSDRDDRSTPSPINGSITTEENSDGLDSDRDDRSTPSPIDGSITTGETSDSLDSYRDSRTPSPTNRSIAKEDASAIDNLDSDSYSSDEEESMITFISQRVINVSTYLLSLFRKGLNASASDLETEPGREETAISADTKQFIQLSNLRLEKIEHLPDSKLSKPSKTPGQKSRNKSNRK